MSINFLVHRSICSTDKNKPQGGGEATSVIQKQTQDTNVTSLMALISKLQQEKNQLQKEKNELLAKQPDTMATKGRLLHVYGCVILVKYMSICSTYCSATVTV